jgi:hypothetical protein
MGFNFVRTAEFALAAGCFLAALPFGGDPMLMGLALFGAWIFATLGIVTAPQVAYGTKAGLSIGVLIFLAVSGGLLYRHANSLNIADENGASFGVEPLPFEKLKDGSYTAPLKIENIGNRSITGWAWFFDQKIQDTAMTPLEEDQFMKIVENDFKQAFGASPDAAVAGGSSLLAPGKPREVINPNLKIGEVDFNQILGGKKFVYSGAVAAYKDNIAQQQGLIYFAERCVHYDANVQNFLDCSGGHNFVKNTTLPKGPEVAPLPIPRRPRTPEKK